MILAKQRFKKPENAAKSKVRRRKKHSSCVQFQTHSLCTTRTSADMGTIFPPPMYLRESLTGFFKGLYAIYACRMPMGSMVHESNGISTGSSTNAIFHFIASFAVQPTGTSSAVPGARRSLTPRFAIRQEAGAGKPSGQLEEFIANRDFSGAVAMLGAGPPSGAWAPPAAQRTAFLPQPREFMVFIFFNEIRFDHLVERAQTHAGVLNPIRKRLHPPRGAGRKGPGDSSSRRRGSPSTGTRPSPGWGTPPSTSASTTRYLPCPSCPS